MSMSVTTVSTEEQDVAVRALPANHRLSSPQKHVQVPFVVASRLLSIFPPVLLGVIILGGWYLSTAGGLFPSYQLPTLTEVWASFWDGLTTGLFWDISWVTIQESIGGFLLAVLISLPLGYGLAKWRLFAAAVQPYLAAGQAIPAIVIAPFLVIWIGHGVVPIVVLCFLVVLFPMVITISLGFSTIDRSLLEAARVEGAAFWPMLIRIEFPLSLPATMAAIRTGLTLSITGALVGEFVVTSDQGLGTLVQIARSQFNTSLMFATVIVLALLAAGFYGISAGLTRLSRLIYM